MSRSLCDIQFIILWVINRVFWVLLKPEIEWSPGCNTLYLNQIPENRPSPLDVSPALPTTFFHYETKHNNCNISTSPHRMRCAFPHIKITAENIIVGPSPAHRELLVFPSHILKTPRALCLVSMETLQHPAVTRNSSIQTHAARKACVS